MDSSDFTVPIDPDQFEEWRKEFPGAFVLNCETSMIHRADCHHFNLRPGRGFSPKWVCASLEPLQKMATAKGWGCETCGCID